MAAMSGAILAGAAIPDALMPASGSQQPPPVYADDLLFNPSLRSGAIPRTRPSGTVVPPVSVNSRPVNARRVEIVEESQSSETESNSESVGHRSESSQRGLPVDPPYLPMPPQHPVGHRLLGTDYRTLNRLTERNPELSRGETMWWDHDGIPFGIDDPRENRPRSNRASCREPNFKRGNYRDSSDDEPPPGYTFNSSRRREPSLDSLSSCAHQPEFPPSERRSRVPPTDSVNTNVNPRGTERASSRRPSRVEPIPTVPETRKRSPPSQPQRIGTNVSRHPRDPSVDSCRNRVVPDQERVIPGHPQEAELGEFRVEMDRYFAEIGGRRPEEAPRVDLPMEVDEPPRPGREAEDLAEDHSVELAIDLGEGAGAALAEDQSVSLLEQHIWCSEHFSPLSMLHQLRLCTTVSLGWLLNCLIEISCSFLPLLFSTLYLLQDHGLLQCLLSWRTGGWRQYYMATNFAECSNTTNELLAAKCYFG
ncbi:hypothetical protein QAD02_021791 [Eretmocerus hayati]|uniref:Uncharacterized protein n=1 Tax=Eretmocerus hayati TaxID=131215 RepID=A0ACC2PSC1_9HYME|nr:hypothetical protein QAD02_021791 [Eretmocerus hayati]